MEPEVTKLTDLSLEHLNGLLISIGIVFYWYNKAIFKRSREHEEQFAGNNFGDSGTYIAGVISGIIDVDAKHYLWPKWQNQMGILPQPSIPF